jgi:hypothetical protein
LRRFSFEEHLKDEVEVIVDGKRKTIRGAAGKMIRWIAEHADFFNSSDVRGEVVMNFAGEGASISPKVNVAPAA